MSFKKQSNGSYKVRWRDSAGRSRSKTVARRSDAITLDADITRKKAMGELISHERGRLTLNDFYREVFGPNYEATILSPRTRDTNARMWRRYIEPTLGSMRLEAIDREAVERLRAKLSAKLAPATVVRIAAVLQSVLQRATEWSYIRSNPARGVRMPRVESRRGRALNDEQIAAIAAELDQRSAVIVRVLAHTGLRPGELRALRWGDLSSGLIRVERAASMSAIGPTKTHQARSVRFRDEARTALLSWYMAQGQPSPDALIFDSDGALWSDSEWNAWQQRVFKPAVSRAGLKGVVPYDLRHTFASRLIAEGRNPVEVAVQLGHSPIQTLKTYAHEFEQQRVGQPAAEESTDLRSILGGA